MKLSIIVPIYKVEEYLTRCLDSFLNNNTKNFEVILVDDGSPDHSGNLADDYSNKYENYHSFHKANGGLSDARNYGLKKATGEFVWFVDSDDYITDGAIDEFIRLNNDVSADVYCFSIDKQIDGRIQENISYKFFDGVKNGNEFLLFQYKNKQFRPEAWRNIYKRKLLIENECYFTKGILHEDDEWTPRTLLKANRIIISRFSAYVYVVRENSIMTQASYDKHMDSILFMMDRYEKYDLGFDSKLNEYVLDVMTNHYISWFSKGKLYNEPKYFLPYRYFKNKIVFLKTRIKVFLFCSNKKLFCLLSKMLTHSKGKSS